MKITKLQIENFRLLKDFSMDLEEDLSLVIGKNNTGKTSILSVLDKFFNEKSKFSYDDLNIDFKNDLEGLIKSEDVPEEFAPKGIKLKIFIEYNEQDDLSNVSRILMDLDPENNKIVLGFEYILTYTKFLELRTDYDAFEKKERKKVEEEKKTKVREVSEFLKQGLDKYFNTQKLSFEFNLSTQKVNELNYINLDKDKISIKDIISFKHIPARRDVTNKDKDNTLSKQTSTLYKKNEDSEEKAVATEEFIDQLSETDIKLSEIYSGLFEGVVKNVSTFGGIKLNETAIEIISTLQHRDLLEGNTTVVYTHDTDKLPEQYNGLGYMNLISMIFEIEILRQEFKRKKEEKPADINLLIIEEPEAHTHPQMQYVFIKNIKKLLAEGVKRDDGISRPLQYIITTHSSHIVADSDFDDIKYLKAKDKNNVVAKNLSDLRKQYDADPSQYQFLKQYLTISRAEIFFADKAILIEGDTERILIPTFMRKVDLEEEARLKAEDKEDAFLPLLSQNISIIEVGAYSQIFEKFIEFLGIKSLILTDIDAIKVVEQDDNGKDVWGACPVNEGTKTSNSAINHFLKEVTWDNLKALPVANRTILVGNSTVCICYQQEEDTYHARSFEDAFIHINRAFVSGKKDEFQGLQNRKLFDDFGNSAYVLADKCIKKKTHFALDILYHSDENFSNWSIPSYIKNGLLWLKED
ncbi:MULTISPECIES: ATP-dependent endonuclease [Weeksellaceae]|uniref:ATP-dependent nuclease n=1 Tax=Weeksellaceae TaxID=2762318 RepID=UPI0028A93399|nr:ATP-dependent endonuclease [Soonwooa sp.]